MNENIKIIITDSDGLLKSDDNQYSSYTFSSEYNSLSSAFSVTLVNVDFNIITSDLIQLWINGAIEFDGIIQRVEKGSDKNSRNVTVTGKDRASILVESYCNNFKDFNSKTPVQIIDSLIAQTNFYTKEKGSVDTVSDVTGFNSSSDVSSINSANLSDVNNSNTLSKRNDKTTYDAEFKALSARNYKINPGDMVFDKINELVKKSGHEILYDNSGELYIGNLNKKRYADEVVYEIVYRKDGKGNNTISANVVDDISGRYSTIMVVAQYDNFFGEQNNVTKVAKDSTYPGVKFQCVTLKDDNESPEKVAIQTREDQRIEGFEAIYTVPGHVSNSGKTWKINRYVNVNDTVNDVLQLLVIYSRVFSFSLSEGRKTELVCSKERLNELEI